MRSITASANSHRLGVLAVVNTGLTAGVGFATATPLNFAAAALWGGLAALLLRK